MIKSLTDVKVFSMRTFIMRFSVYPGTVLFFLLLVMSCSNDSGIIIPSNQTSNNSSVLPSYDKIPVLLSDRFPDGTPREGMGTLGIFSLHLDPARIDAKLNPLRNADSTDVLEIVDITNFLTLAPCTDCARIKSVSVNIDGDFVVQIGIKHPFEQGEPLKPITGRNRADLHVFNVEGTIISDGSGVIFFPGLQEIAGDLRLISADGYSPYLDDVLDGLYPTNATLHPYVLHFDDYSIGNFNPLNPMGFESVTEPPPSGNLVMAMGCDYDYQDYVFNLDSAAPVDFIYAIGCTYGFSALVNSDRFNPEYRVPQYNKKAASEVRVDIITNDLKSHQPSSSATLEIEVVDISHRVAVGENLDEMYADSSVGIISIEIPGVISSPKIIASPIPASGSGHNPSDPLKYEITIENSALGAEGIYRGLVKILDTYPAGINKLPLLHTKDGIKRVNPDKNPISGLFEINEFATYAVFKINVGPGSVTDPPVAVISSPCGDDVIHANSSIFFDGRMSTDDGSIVGYAWDFDWDMLPQNFDIESTLDHLNHQFATTGGFVVGLRVEDDEGQFDYANVNVSVDPPITPSWDPGILIGATPGRDTTERDFEPGRSIVVDCDGVIHCVIKNTTSNTLYYVNYDGSVVSSPETIIDFSQGLVQPTLELDPNHYDLHLTYYALNAIKYQKRTGGVWSTPEDIIVPDDIPGFGLGYASMSVNYLGDIMVVFYKSDSSYVWFNSYIINDGSGWSDPVDICELYVRISSGSFTRPETTVRADNEGRFHLIFKSWPSATAISQYHLFHSIYHDGIWEPVNRFNQDSGLNIAVSGFVSPDGDVFCVWQTSRFGTFNAMYQRWDVATATWGTPIRVTQNPIPGDYSFIPDITVDADGHVVYTWEYFDGVIRHVYYKTFNELDSAPTIFNSAETDVENTAGNMTNPNMFLAVDGKAHLLWEDDRSQPGNYEARDIYYSVFD